MVRGAGCREINLRIRRREKNVLDIPFYRSGVLISLRRLFAFLEGQNAQWGCYDNDDGALGSTPDRLGFLKSHSLKCLNQNESSFLLNGETS